MAEDGSLPREIDGFLASLAGRSLAQAALPAHRGHRPPRQSGHGRASRRRHRTASSACPRVETRTRPPAARPKPPDRPSAQQSSRPIARARADPSHEPDPANIRTQPGDPEAAQPSLEAPARPLRRDDRRCGTPCSSARSASDVSATTARIDRERKRAATAREIEQLKKSLAPHRDLIGSGDDVHELMRHVMRPHPILALRLIDLKPEKPKDLGPFEAIGLQLNLEGSFADIDRVPRLGRDRQDGCCGSTRSGSPPTVAKPGRLAGQVDPRGPGRQGRPDGEDQGRNQGRHR